MADISSITLPGGGTYDLKDKNAASAVTSLNNRYTDNTLWISNSDANDYKTSGMYAMATGNANTPASWGILFVIAPRHDTIEQEYRYSWNIWNREFRNNTWSAWTLAAKQSQLAYVENGTTATRNYTAGQYICRNGLLYTADTVIASGATFYTSGGNKNLTECVGGGLNSIIDDAIDFTRTITPSRADIFSASRSGKMVQVCVNNLSYNQNFTTDTKIAEVSPAPVQFTRFILHTGSRSALLGFINVYGDVCLNGYTSGTLLYGSFCYLTK